jgi:quinol monooxygenase YgiN
MVSMIIGTLRLQPGPDRRADVLELLRSIQGPVRAQPGCAELDIYDAQGEGAEPMIVLMARWESREALEAHLRSEIYRRILTAIELSGGPPDIRFEHVSACEGIELIERSRGVGRTAAG